MEKCWLKILVPLGSRNLFRTESGSGPRVPLSLSTCFPSLPTRRLPVGLCTHLACPGATLQPPLPTREAEGHCARQNRPLSPSILAHAALAFLSDSFHLARSTPHLAERWLLKESYWTLLKVIFRFQNRTRKNNDFTCAWLNQSNLIFKMSSFMVSGCFTVKHCEY